METTQPSKREVDIEKMKNGFSAVERFVNKAIYTDYYLWTILAIVFIAWVTECAPFGFITLILVSSFVLVFSRDLLPLFANIFGAVLMIYTDKVDEFLYLWPVFIPLGIAIVFFAVRNIILKKRAGDKFQLGKLFFPQVAVAVALIVGGAGVVSGERYLVALPNVLALGAGVLAVYVLARNFILKNSEVDTPTYLAKILAYIGVVVSIQLIVVVARSGLPPLEWIRAYWFVGWGNRNNVSTYLLFTAPMCLYLSTKYKRLGVVYMLMAVLQYICLIITFSRGGILFGFIALVFGLGFSIYKAKNRKMYLILLGCVAGLMLVLYLCFMNKVNDAIASLLARGTGLSNRDLLWIEGWDLFKKNPFQGAGFGYMGSMGEIVHEAIGVYYFHSTLLQVLACMGILGILAYGYNYAFKGMVLFKNMRNPFNLFVIVVLIGFEGYSMIDTGTMIPFPYMLLVTIIFCVVEMFTATPEMIEADKLQAQADKELRALNKSKKFHKKFKGEKFDTSVENHGINIETSETGNDSDEKIVVEEIGSSDDKADAVLAEENK